MRRATTLNLGTSHEVNAVTELLVIVAKLAVHWTMRRHHRWHFPSTGRQRAREAVIVHDVNINFIQQALSRGCMKHLGHWLTEPS